VACPSQVGQAQALEFGAAASTDAVSQWDTGVDADVLRWVGARSVETPDAFQLHSTLRRGHVDARLAKLRAGVGLDWSTAETLALASLLYQGHHVRLCGQDVGRGTFSQVAIRPRHSQRRADGNTDESIDTDLCD